MCGLGIKLGLLATTNTIVQFMSQRRKSNGKCYKEENLKVTKIRKVLLRRKS